LSEGLDWGPPPQGLARAVVEFVLDVLEVFGGVDGEVRALGDVVPEQPIVFSLVPRCHGECGSQKYTLIPVAAVISRWPAISLPWSHVSERRSSAGSSPMTCRTPSRVAWAVWRMGRCTRSTYRLGGPTRGAIAARVGAPGGAPRRVELSWSSPDARQSLPKKIGTT